MAYTNPSFCQQSEYIRDDRNNDELPPPPQFQANDELPPPTPSPPPPPPVIHHQQQQQQSQQPQQQQQHHYDVGQTNPGFQYRNEEISVTRPNDRYCYLNERKIRGSSVYQDNYGIQTNERRPIMHEREVISRYEYILDDDDDVDNCDEIDEKVLMATSRARTPDDTLSRNKNIVGSLKYGFVKNDSVPAVFAYQQKQRRDEPRKIEHSRYALVPVNSIEDERMSSKEQRGSWASSSRNNLAPTVLCQRSNSTRGRYARVPTQEVLDPPLLPERNIRDQRIVTRQPEEMNYQSPRNNIATQKLHEILTSPRKSRSRSEERHLSPSKRQQQFVGGAVAQRGATTPTGSPSGRFVSSPSGLVNAGTPSGKRDQRQMLQGSSQRGIDSSPSNSGNATPHTSTPNKEPSARRCLPLNLDNPNASRPRETRDSPSCPASNCGRQRYPQRGHSVASYGIVGSHGEPPPRYAYLDGLTEAIPMVSGSPRYQVVPVSDEKSVESAFIARTAVVPPLSPPNSEANTTLASGMEKSERRNAPLLLLLVGILTCGLALYLSWSQGRRYYLDSAAGCGACCALAGACRSLRRTWTGLGLAGLSALSCAGLLLIAAKAPRPGTPLHDVTAGALCGVSLLGAALALIALLSPKCNIARHRRVHSWIPRFSP